MGLWEFVDWVFPPNCGGCGQRGESWCTECQGITEPYSSHVCHVCGRRVDVQDHLCQNCTFELPVFTGLRSYSSFSGPLRNAIHQLKYRRDIGLGKVFANMLFEVKRKLDWQVDFVIPVPLSQARVRQRGYNQAAIIAYPFSLISGIRYSSQLLQRTRNTRSQVGLSKQERRENVQNAFTAHPTACNQKSILIIDDVMTTGSTLSACAAALLKARANEVFCLTVARSEFDPTEMSVPSELIGGKLRS